MWPDSVVCVLTRGCLLRLLKLHVYTDNDRSPVRCQGGKHKRLGLQDAKQKRPCSPKSWNDVGHLVCVYQYVFEFTFANICFLKQNVIVTIRGVFVSDPPKVFDS